MASFSLAGCAWPWSMLAQSELCGQKLPPIHLFIKEEGSVVQTLPFSALAALVF